MINWYKNIIVIVLMTLFSSGIVITQNTVKKSSRAKLEYIKNPDESQYLLANIKVREDRYVPIKDANIIFYSIGDTTEIKLGEALTNSNGDAKLMVEDIESIYKDSEGYITFEAVYEGNDSINDRSADIMVKPANMDLSFFQKDSIKSININLFEIGNDGESIPIEDETVMFFVKGTFSLLNFAEETTDEEGNIDIEFPITMPGDTSGVLTIVTKVESDDYGIIESQEAINWGKPLKLDVEKHRGLGDTDAPLWMVYTLIILLSAVWFHYFYVIYLIVKIKLARRVFT